MPALTARPTPTSLLLAVLRRDPAFAPHDLRARDWEALSEAAGRHDVMPLLWHRLRDAGYGSLAPDAVGRRLEAAHTLGVLRAEARRAQLREILVTLAACGIPVVLLKGAFLATHAYPSAALRPMGDLDLLVPAERVVAAVEALASVGYPSPDALDWQVYRTHRHPPPLHRPGRLPVELHHAIDPWMPPFTARLTDVWARCRPVGMHGVCALALAPEDALLHVATHMGYSHLLGSSLLRLCDVGAWLDRFGAAADWDAVVRRARDSGARRFVYTALGLTHHLLGAPVPPDVLRALRDDADAAVIRDATALLEAPPSLLPGVLALTRPEQTVWRRLRRLVRALAWPPPREGGPVAGRPGAGATRGRRAAWRWRALARCLRDPAAARAAVRSIVQVRRLRSWAHGAD